MSSVICGAQGCVTKPLCARPQSQQAARSARRLGLSSDRKQHRRTWKAEVPSDAPDASPVATKYWTWKGWKIRYKEATNPSSNAPNIVFVHGFGGNADQWRKNTPALSSIGNTYSIDLLGYGYSDKPSPRGREPNTLYTFETWGRQLHDFAQEVIGGPCYIVCNSVGGVAGLQTAVDHPESVNGLILLNISLRMLHERKTPSWQRPFVQAIQYVLRETPLGGLFFSSVARPESVENVLKSAYEVDSAVDEELVNYILKPGLEPGAVDVFLDFISYSGGPLPEDLIPKVQCPLMIGWGEKDPWEPVKMGEKFASYPTVEDFVRFPTLGHCPMDEGPQIVNPVLIEYIMKWHSGGSVEARAKSATAA